MICTEIQSKLLDFSRDRLSVLEAREIKEHLAACAECREVLAAEEALDRRLRDLPVAAAQSDIWPLVRSRIRGRRPVFARWLIGTVIGAPKRALAAGLAIVFVALVIALNLLYVQPRVTPSKVSTVTVQSVQPTDAYDDPMGENTERMLAAIDGET